MICSPCLDDDDDDDVKANFRGVGAKRAANFFYHETKQKARPIWNTQKLQIIIETIQLF